MYIAGDEVVLLRDLGDVVLASCEGVIGWVRKGDARFVSMASTSGRSSQDVHVKNALPRTVLTAPSPPTTQSMTLPDEPTAFPGPLDLKRISGPFELESPQQSPGIEKEGQRYFPQQQTQPQQEPMKRDSMASATISEAYDGIGGFMMGDETSEEGHDSLDDGMEELRGPYSLWLTKLS